MLSPPLHPFTLTFLGCRCPDTKGKRDECVVRGNNNTRPSSIVLHECNNAIFLKVLHHLQDKSGKTSATAFYCCFTAVCCFILLLYSTCVTEALVLQAQNGQDKCGDFIEAHKACLRKEGFTVA